MAWIAPVVSGAIAASSPFIETTTFAYVSDGDTNGFFYWLGTERGTTTWSNPSVLTSPSSNQVLASQSSDVDGVRTAEKGTNRSNATNNEAHTNSTSTTPWWQVDLTSTGLEFQVDDIVYHQRAATFHNLQTWEFQGSPDGSNWFTLTINTTNPLPLNGYYREQPSANGSVYWRYLRIQMTGKTTDNTDFLIIGDVEVYGAARTFA